MSTRTAHLALYDGAAEMEVGHLLAELHTGRFTGTAFDVVTIAESREWEPYEVDGDLYTSGSGTLVRAMLADGLVDELHLLVRRRVW